jgi:hypothetical protein
MGVRFALFLTAMALALPAAAAMCSAESGGRTAALVELYTSEGCSSCPPADRWLSRLGERGYARERVVPLALHVDYWDYLGWKDRHARREFSLRQRKLTQLQRLALVYTPQVMLQGRDFREWGSPAFDAAVARINAQPALARIALHILAAESERLDVEAKAELSGAQDKGDAALYLATYENRVVSRVSAGENSGRKLEHDYVVFEWQGPFAFGQDGRLVERRFLRLLPGGAAKASGVAAFVQNRRTGVVLQALMLPAC